MKKIIGLAAKARSGKDTAASILLGHPEVAAYALADPLKAGCKALFGLTDSQAWDDTLKEKRLEAWGLSPREFFQHVGTEWFRDYDPLHWLKRADRAINNPPPFPRELTPEEAEDPETPFIVAAQSFFGLTDDQVWTEDGRDFPDEFWNLSPNTMIQLVKRMTTRDFLHFENQRKEHLKNNLTAKHTSFKNAKLTLENKEIILIKDIRFENEAEYIRNLGGDIWNIVRKDVQKVKNHSSEAGIKVKPGDILIENNGTLEEYTNLIERSFSDLKNKLSLQTETPVTPAT
ncbi:deoxynucleotide monophosphate kinase [Pseudomonas sp. PD9R]|uniref:deoxynucleotide monophosphate kinase family protein n=1 Tax=Pseudomonas sp. PD9R TaxID=2853534 RepID=UPI001C43693D|nr:deoxynucleotide monophosphate kinase [Pseudomonas sp. PD9R]MBV6825702.1 deoxynucleotide monophosphate kinase [Pseudomonas sp. PD9R]